MLHDFLRLNHDKCFTVKQICEQLSESSISLSALYRNLGALQKEGLVSRSVSDSGRETVYRYIDPEHCENRIHLTCMGCGRTLHLEDRAAAALKTAVVKEGFHISPARSTLYGMCTACELETEKK